MLNTKTKLIILFISLAVGLFISFRPKIENELNKSAVQNSQSEKTQNQQDEPPRIVSTKPDSLEESIIPADEVIEINFNRPLENVGEFKVRIEPKTDYKLELSGDRKVGRIIPVKPYELGTAYTLYIGSETKFDGIGRWGQEKTYHFRTIKYRGI
ncbi:hypothetical protein HYW41_00780 [Candidatus Daviesbacteria bacterium]|nr:hypothetical protein [Candidatus Daviesbacteria bacterium]